MSEEIKIDTYWKKHFKENKWLIIVIIIAVASIITGAFLVLFWFMETSPIGLLGEATFDQWNLDWVVGFIILIILWELLFVGVPTVIFIVVVGYIWWNRLSDEDKAEFKARDKKKHRARNTGGEGGFGFVMFIAYCILHGVKGTYYASFGSQPYSYWVYTWFETFMWIAIVIGVPIIIILIIVYFAVWRKKSEEIRINPNKSE